MFRADHYECGLGGVGLTAGILKEKAMSYSYDIMQRTWETLRERLPLLDRAPTPQTRINLTVTVESGTITVIRVVTVTVL
jgi:hypothetical protein